MRIYATADMLQAIYFDKITLNDKKTLDNSLGLY